MGTRLWGSTMCSHIGADLAPSRNTRVPAMQHAKQETLVKNASTCNKSSVQKCKSILGSLSCFLLWGGFGPLLIHACMCATDTWIGLGACMYNFKRVSPSVGVPLASHQLQKIQICNMHSTRHIHLCGTYCHLYPSLPIQIAVPLSRTNASFNRLVFHFRFLATNCKVW